jgi:hypothetical protein
MWRSEAIDQLIPNLGSKLIALQSQSERLGEQINLFLVPEKQTTFSRAPSL